MNDVVVVGGSTAGLSAAQTLREEGYDGRLTIVGAELWEPYDRTALSKRVLADGASLDEIRLASAAETTALDADWRSGVAATRLDLRARRVTLSDGEELPYGGLVLATGSSARSLSEPTLDGVLGLRTLDDALTLRGQLRPGARVVLVGGGFVGLEVAAAASALGGEATVLEAGAQPLEQALGARVGAAVAERHRLRGVTVRCHVRVRGWRGDDGRVTGVRLAGGEIVPADLVVVGIGARPEIAWIASSGLCDPRGVICDQHLATAADDVVAAGDVAAWPHPAVGGLVRVEHFEHAQLSGAAAARRLLHSAAACRPYDGQPFVWSHQFDHALHVAGFPHLADESRVVDGELADGPFAVEYRSSGRRIGVMTLDMPREFRRLRRELAAEGAPT